MHMKNIVALKKIAKSLSVSEIANVVLNDKRFAICSGSSKPIHHHYGDGGLQKHTFEVVELCLQNNEYFKPLNKAVCDRKLFLAALFHDSGKMWDYTYSRHILYNGSSDRGEIEGWIATPHKRNIHHISRSGILWSQSAKHYGFEDQNDDHGEDMRKDHIKDQNDFNRSLINLFGRNFGNLTFFFMCNKNCEKI